MQKNYVVVVLNGPRLNAHGFPARGDDEGRFDPARTEKAVAVAKRLATMGEHVVVIPCGDAAPVHGEDLAEMVRLIKAAGVPCSPANNGGTNMNTFGDCAVAACNIKAFIDTGNSIGNITLVTCWYHGPRAAIQLRNALWREGIVGASVTVRSVVWGRVLHGLRVLHDELRGTYHAWLQRPERSHGPRYGKPGYHQASK